MKYLQIPVGPMENLSYLLWDEGTGSAAVIDPAWQPELIEEKLKTPNINLDLILLTHAHPDHINACSYFLEKYTNLKILMHKEEEFLLEKPFDRTEYLRDGQEIKLGDEKLTVLHTPGHTPGSVCYLWKNLLFTGDTLFLGCCGRVDLPGSDPEAMRQSLLRISRLSENIELLPGHAYNGFKTTIKAQKPANICFKYLNDKEDFYRVVV
ncbi:MAG: MBL fold hydrolase [Elusimicrobia bacterium CG08_land_8_20_14_0_20_51_18]|nr:MAG: MBL fold hydrolase [Elusimicrobia bacterium CG08_land_8_20_14_0_20_51_18]